jgi:hypothetical protein
VHEKIRRHLFLSHVCGIVCHFSLHHECCALQNLCKLGDNMELHTLPARSRHSNDWRVHFSSRNDREHCGNGTPFSSFEPVRRRFA